MAYVDQNHLIETASSQTGTMLIWDTGEYEVLEKTKKIQNSYDSDSDPDAALVDTFPSNCASAIYSQPEQLATAFQRRKIRLRLNGTRLPHGYTLYIRLTKDNDRSAQPRAPAFRRRRKAAQEPLSKRPRRASTSSTSSSSSDTSSSKPDSDASIAIRSATHRRLRRTVSSLKRTASPPHRSKTKTTSKLETMASGSTPDISGAHSPSATHVSGDEQAASLAASDDDSDETIRRNNAYSGATNTVGSIHQRKWYLSLDRELSGFKPIPTPRHISHHAKTYWVPDAAVKSDGIDAGNPLEASARAAPGFERFHVLGRDHERSVVTGRLAADILVDEGVEGYVPRGLWRPVLE